MHFFYISLNKSYNFSLFHIKESQKTKDELIETIRRTPEFCRESESIETSTLIQFIKQPSNITVYSMENEELTGVINFAVKSERDSQKYIHINGLCVPERNAGSGLGKKLITKIILFSKEYNFNKLKLICSGDVFKFYKKLGFNVETVSKGNDSDDSSDSDVEKYNMVLYVDSFNADDTESDAPISDESSIRGGKSRKTKTIKRTKRSKRSKKSKKSKRTKRTKKSSSIK